jgi:hypothetical protein
MSVIFQVQIILVKKILLVVIALGWVVFVGTLIVLFNFLLKNIEIEITINTPTETVVILKKE